MYMDTEEEEGKPLEEEKQSELQKKESFKESLQAMTFESLDHVYVKILLTDSSLLTHIKTTSIQINEFLKGFLHGKIGMLSPFLQQ